MIGYSILFFRGFLKFFSSLPPSSLLSVLNPQPQLSRHLTISHAVPVCASSLKNFFLLFFKLLNATPWPLYGSHRGGKCENKKKRKVKSEIVSVLKWLWPIPRWRESVFVMAFSVLPLELCPVNSKNCVSFPSGQVCPILHSTDRGHGGAGKASRSGRKARTLYWVLQRHFVLMITV